MSTFLESDRLALVDTGVLPLLRFGELRNIRAHVAGGVAVDEISARWVDRHQDEIDRRREGFPMPEVLAEHIRQKYGRTGPKENS